MIKGLWVTSGPKRRPQFLFVLICKQQFGWTGKLTTVARRKGVNEMASTRDAETVASISRQQRAERYYFGRFQNVYPLPSTNVTFGDKPDVIIHAERSIGVEITNLYHIDGERPESEQRQRERRQAVVVAAQGIYERGPHKNIELTFGFDDAHPIGNGRAQRSLAQKLADVARRVQESEENGQIAASHLENVPEVNFGYLYGHYVECDYPLDHEFPDGPPDSFTDFKRYMNRRDSYARQVGVRRPLRERAKWKPIKVHSGCLLSVDRATEIIAVKEAKAKQYKTCDAYWLLIVVDFLDPAQDSEIRIDGFEGFRSTVFERVIVYRPYFEHILDRSPA
ncbi:MAG: hypothetical protein ABI759_16190 [Candidatus Solibacter sp.]